eukprot:1158942-Pelagomonas_calceolata.AAC.4
MQNRAAMLDPPAQGLKRAWNPSHKSCTCTHARTHTHTYTHILQSHNVLAHLHAFTSACRITSSDCTGRWAWMRLLIVGWQMWLR